ncbi:protein kinase [Histoplasma ohiense]|nr:protein kinase [Histoplasma ohiense (nom. inval.)]
MTRTIGESTLFGPITIARQRSVVLGCGWKMSTDIWNLGILICSIFLGSDLTHNTMPALGYHPSQRTVPPDLRCTRPI